MKNDTAQTPDVPRIVPVFPLPNTVFFPRTSIPLHIFEPRYQAMIEDVIAGDRLLVVSLKVGEDFQNLGTLGRVQDLESLEDGSYDLRLVGLDRVAIREVPCDTPYRQVRIEPRPERLGSDDPSVIESSKLDLLATLGLLRSVVQQQEPVVLQQGLPFEVVVNSACAGIPIEAAIRQELLAENDLVGRQRQVSDHLAVVIDAISQLGLIDQTGDSQLN